MTVKFQVIELLTQLKSEIEKIESLDRLFFRRLLSLPQTTPREAFYLEMGAIPLRFLLKGRWVIYLHHILKKDKSGMLYPVFITQWHHPCKGEWTEQIKKDRQFQYEPILAKSPRGDFLSRGDRQTGGQVINQQEI